MEDSFFDKKKGSSLKKGGDEGLEIAKLGIASEIVSDLTKRGITKMFPILNAGEVVYVRLASSEDGSSWGFGYIEFAGESDAQKAFELNGLELLGRAVRLDFACERGSYTPHTGKENNA